VPRQGDDCVAECIYVVSIGRVKVMICPGDSQINHGSSNMLRSSLLIVRYNVCFCKIDPVLSRNGLSQRRLYQVRCNCDSSMLVLKVIFIGFVA